MVSQIITQSPFCFHSDIFFTNVVCFQREDARGAMHDQGTICHKVNSQNWQWSWQQRWWWCSRIKMFLVIMRIKSCGQTIIFLQVYYYQPKDYCPGQPNFLFNWNTLFWFIRALPVILILVTIIIVIIIIIIIIILKNSIGGIFWKPLSAVDTRSELEE